MTRSGILMTRIFKTKSFAKRAKAMGLVDESLFNAIREISQGLYDAHLGGHVYKKRVPLGHSGKRGGGRTIIAFKLGDKAIFMYGFPKSERDNLSQKEVDALKALGDIYFEYSEWQIENAIHSGDLIEVNHAKIH